MFWNPFVEIVMDKVDVLSRIAVHTWNVAGKPPPDDLDLEEWIGDSQPADIYVFG